MRVSRARHIAAWSIAVITLPCFAAAAHAQSGSPLLLRSPAVNATDICFTFGGDLWTVARAGGTATRPESEYAVENRGVAPDVEVEVDPAAWRAGKDNQLERAVELLMKQLGTMSPKPAKRPAYPTWAKEASQP